MKTERPRLVGSTTSLFVRKVRVALLEKGVEHDFDACSSWNPQSPANHLNPLKKVPVLLWPGRSPLFDSRVIVQALERWAPRPALLPTDPEAHLEALQLEALADGVSEAVALFTQEGWREPMARSGVWKRRQQDKFSEGLTALDAAISQWLPAKDKPPGLVAIAAGSAFAFARFWQPSLIDALSLPRMDALASCLARRSAWSATAPALPAGTAFPRL